MIPNCLWNGCLKQEVSSENTPGVSSHTVMLMWLLCSGNVDDTYKTCMLFCTQSVWSVWVELCLVLRQVSSETVTWGQSQLESRCCNLQVVSRTATPTHTCWVDTHLLTCGDFQPVHLRLSRSVCCCTTVWNGFHQPSHWTLIYAVSSDFIQWRRRWNSRQAAPIKSFIFPESRHDPDRLPVQSQSRVHQQRIQRDLCQIWTWLAGVFFMCSETSHHSNNPLDPVLRLFHFLWLGHQHSRSQWGFLLLLVVSVRFSEKSHSAHSHRKYFFFAPWAFLYLVLFAPRGSFCNTES